MVPATEFVIPPIVGLPRTLMRGRNPGEAKTTFSLSPWERAGVRVKAGIQRRHGRRQSHSNTSANLRPHSHTFVCRRQPA